MSASSRERNLPIASLLTTLLIALSIAVSVSGRAGADSAAQATFPGSFWDTETVLSIDAVSPHFDYLVERGSRGEVFSTMFSFIDATTGDLHVARWDAGGLNIEMVEASPGPDVLVGVGNDLFFFGDDLVISYSHLNTADGHGQVAFARRTSIWTTETVDSVNGGGSTLTTNYGGHNFPYGPIVIYSGANGLFVARPGEGEFDWTSVAIDATAPTSAPLSFASDFAGNPTLAYCGKAATSGALRVARPVDDDNWRSFPIAYQACADVVNFIPIKDHGETFFYSTDDHLYMLDRDDEIVVDSAPSRGWIGRGLSGIGYPFDYYKLAYTAFNPKDGNISLRAAFYEDGSWLLFSGPAGDFAPWTTLERLHTTVDGRVEHISILFYDIEARALKRASWPPEPDIYLPIIR